MTNIFAPNLGIPLEREYEGWIIRGILDDLAERGISATAKALGWENEKKTGADDSLKYGDGTSGKWKVIGLQFKRPEMREVGAAASRLHWKIDLDQLKVIRDWNPPNEEVPECDQDDRDDEYSRRPGDQPAVVMYALPTFIDRGAFRAALHHCLFWLPVDEWGKGQKSATANYALPANPNASTDGVPGFPEVRKDAWRWGEVVERLLSCGIGRTFVAHDDLRNWIATVSAEFAESLRVFDERDRDTDEREESLENLTLLILRLDDGNSV